MHERQLVLFPYFFQMFTNNYSTALKCMTTFNVFAYFWHNILIAKHTHSRLELQGLLAFVQINMTQSSQFHTGMCTSRSQILMLKVCEYIKSGLTFGHHMSVIIMYE
jgi:hypothetical protein